MNNTIIWEKLGTFRVIKSIDIRYAVGSLKKVAFFHVFRFCGNFLGINEQVIDTSAHVSNFFLKIFATESFLFRFLPDVLCIRILVSYNAVSDYKLCRGCSNSGSL